MTDDTAERKPMVGDWILGQGPEEGPTTVRIGVISAIECSSIWWNRWATDQFLQIPTRFLAWNEAMSGWEFRVPPTSKNDPPMIPEETLNAFRALTAVIGSGMECIDPVCAAQQMRNAPPEKHLRAVVGMTLTEVFKALAPLRGD